MGKVLKAAGDGGKVSAENLTAENIKAGITVTVKQGNKKIKRVEGKFRQTYLSYGNYAYNIKDYDTSCFRLEITGGSNTPFKKITVLKKITNVKFHCLQFSQQSSVKLNGKVVGTSGNTVFSLDKMEAGETIEIINANATGYMAYGVLITGYTLET